MRGLSCHAHIQIFAQNILSLRQNKHNFIETFDGFGIYLYFANITENVFTTRFARKAKKHSKSYCNERDLVVIGKVGRQ